MTQTPAEIAAIAKGLTAAQRRALVHKNAGGHSYSWTTINTLEALYKRRLVRRKCSHGAFYSPRTAIEWPLTPLGQLVAQHLKENGRG